MHFAIIGAGSVGCLYGGNLARIGEQVTMIDIWDEHIQAMQSNGLQVSGLHGDFTVQVAATTDPSQVENADVALICVNSYDTIKAAQSAQTVLKEGGYAVTLQNGLGNVEALTEVLGQDRVVGGMILQSADMPGPGQVNHTNHGPVHMGELGEAQTDRLSVLAKVFTKAEMNPVIEDDIMTTIWGKFVHNCGVNAICAITDLRPGYIHQVPMLDEFQTKIIEETLALVQARDITLPDPDPLSSIKAFCASKFHRPSMVQHLMGGKQTEIDSLNGYVARESEKLGLAAPYSDALTRLIKGLEHRVA